MAVDASDIYDPHKWKQTVDKIMKDETDKGKSKKVDEDNSSVRWPKRSRVNLEQTCKQYHMFLDNQIKNMDDSNPLKKNGIKLYKKVIKDYEKNITIETLESNIKVMEDYFKGL